MGKNLMQLSTCALCAFLASTGVAFAGDSTAIKPAASNGVHLPAKPSPANGATSPSKLPAAIRDIKVNPNGKVDIKRLKVVALTEGYSKEQCKASFPDFVTIGVSQNVFKLEDKNSILITHRDNRIQGNILHFQGLGNWKGEREGPFQFHVTGFINAKSFYGMSIDSKCIMMFSMTPHPNTLQAVTEDGTVVPKHVPEAQDQPVSQEQNAETELNTKAVQ